MDLQVYVNISLENVIFHRCSRTCLALVIGALGYLKY